LKFVETPVAGAWLIVPERNTDVRGFFARTFCEEEFKKRRLDAHVAQCNISFNDKKGTLRGMHYQAAPYAETKLARCTTGAIHDVVVDIRRDSPTYRATFGAELTAENHSMLYIPAGCAHGFITLVDASEVLYQMSSAFVPTAGRGVRWNDPAFAIAWPIAPAVVSGKDAGWPDWRA
jgi:dTDP-4-dehydrorhamnose 3,5-epimerase